MTTAQTTNARDPGRWMALYAVIVAAMAAAIDGTIMGLIAPAVAQEENDKSKLNLLKEPVAEKFYDGFRMFFYLSSI